MKKKSVVHELDLSKFRARRQTSHVSITGGLLPEVDDADDGSEGEENTYTDTNDGEEIGEVTVVVDTFGEIRGVIRLDETTLNEPEDGEVDSLDTILLVVDMVKEVTVMGVVQHGLIKLHVHLKSLVSLDGGTRQRLNINPDIDKVAVSIVSGLVSELTVGNSADRKVDSREDIFRLPVTRAGEDDGVTRRGTEHGESSVGTIMLVLGVEVRVTSNIFHLESGRLLVPDILVIEVVTTGTDTADVDPALRAEETDSTPTIRGPGERHINHTVLTEGLDLVGTVGLVNDFLTRVGFTAVGDTVPERTRTRLISVVIDKLLVEKSTILGMEVRSDIITATTIGKRPEIGPEVLELVKTLPLVVGTDVLEVSLTGVDLVESLRLGSLELGLVLIGREQSSESVGERGTVGTNIIGTIILRTEESSEEHIRLVLIISEKGFRSHTGGDQTSLVRTNGDINDLRLTRTLELEFLGVEELSGVEEVVRKVLSVVLGEDGIVRISDTTHRLEEVSESGDQKLVETGRSSRSGEGIELGATSEVLHIRDTSVINTVSDRSGADDGSGPTNGVDKSVDNVGGDLGPEGSTGTLVDGGRFREGGGIDHSMEPVDNLSLECVVINLGLKLEEAKSLFPGDRRHDRKTGGGLGGTEVGENRVSGGHVVHVSVHLDTNPVESINGSLGGTSVELGVKSGDGGAETGEHGMRELVSTNVGERSNGVSTRAVSVSTSEDGGTLSVVPSKYKGGVERNLGESSPPLENLKLVRNSDTEKLEGRTNTGSAVTGRNVTGGNGGGTSTESTDRGNPSKDTSGTQDTNVGVVEYGVSLGIGGALSVVDTPTVIKGRVGGTERPRSIGETGGGVKVDGGTLEGGSLVGDTVGGENSVEETNGDVREKSNDITGGELVEDTLVDIGTNSRVEKTLTHGEGVSSGGGDEKSSSETGSGGVDRRGGSTRLVSTSDKVSGGHVSTNVGTVVRNAEELSGRDLEVLVDLSEESEVDGVQVDDGSLGGEESVDGGGGVNGHGGELSVSNNLAFISQINVELGDLFVVTEGTDLVEGGLLGTGEDFGGVGEVPEIVVVELASFRHGKVGVIDITLLKEWQEKGEIERG